jgi:hypothetical protein
MFLTFSFVICYVPVVNVLTLVLKREVHVTKAFYYENILESCTENDVLTFVFNVCIACKKALILYNLFTLSTARRLNSCKIFYG